VFDVCLVIRDNTPSFALDRHGNEVELSELTSDREMPAEVKKEIQLEIAHVASLEPKEAK